MAHDKIKAAARRRMAETGESSAAARRPRGHRTMATAPQITMAMRHAKGDQVRLQGQFG